MSKIGRRPIDISGVSIEIKEQEVHYKGSKGSGIYVLPNELEAVLEDTMLKIMLSKSVQGRKRSLNRIWGLHRALLANKIVGVAQEFAKQIQINGLGYKAIVSGNKLVFSLGFSHKIDFDLPKEVSVNIDKSGQKLTFKSFDKELVGHISSQVRSLRPPEPYKGTGIKFESEIIIRKAGKTKSV